MTDFDIYQFIRRYYNQGKNYVEIVKWILKKAFLKEFFQETLVNNNFWRTAIIMPSICCYYYILLRKRLEKRRETIIFKL